MIIKKYKAPVWTTLYAFMSIAIWIVYEKTKVSEPSFSKKIIKIYFYHLVENKFFAGI